MKITKIILLLAIMTFFTSPGTSVKAVEILKDCSGLKKLSHKWVMCKAGSRKYDDEITISATPKTKKEKKAKKELKTGFWKKIKNFGGEKIGQPD